MIEIWRDVVGYDGKYQVSNFGRVKSFKHKTPRILKPIFERNGYLHVNLCRNKKIKHAFIHRLVAEAFIDNPDDKPQVNHINGDKADNRVVNLEWCTLAANMRHAVATGLFKSGEDRYGARFTNEQARYIRDNPDGLNTYELGRQFGVTPQTISRIQRGKTYCDAGGKIRKPKPKAPRTPDEIRERIRAEYVPHKRGCGTTVLAHKYGVSQATVWNIINEN